ncbi:hypothetical protein ACN4D1_10360 [Corynebacterium macclintockiae]|uniref:hypothetical protein n=1 Tax=Corynebacterium macclintockiae TaxID=2913501 RepID=UPI003EBBEB33
MSFDDTGGGVDQFLACTGQVAHQGVERRINPGLGPTSGRVSRSVVGVTGATGAIG